MATTTRKVQRALTDDELANILAKIRMAANPADALIQAVQGTFNALLADLGTTWNECESITPWEYAIPESQWGEIASALTARDMSLSMEWVNYGCSGFTVEA